MFQQTDNCKGKQVITGEHYTTTNNHISIGPSWRIHKLVSWCFKPSQPQRITSGLSIHKCILIVFQKQKATTKKFLTKQHLQRTQLH